MTKTIPIVFVAAGDPVGIGVVDSLARPGGNLTRADYPQSGVKRKRLELLKEASPRITRAGLPIQPLSSGAGQLILEETERAAKGLGIQIQSLEVRSLNDFDGAFAAAIRESAHALIPAASPIINTHRARVLEFAFKNRLPTIFGNPKWKRAASCRMRRISPSSFAAPRFT